MLEIAIGVIFVFLLVSLIASAIRELIEAKLKTRAAYLEQGLRELLNDPAGTKGLARAVFEHPLIFGLYASGYEPTGDPEPGTKNDVKHAENGITVSNLKPAMLARGGTLPSYIPSRSIAVALLDLAARGARTDAVSGDPDAPPLTLAAARANVANLGDPFIQRVVLAAIDDARGDMASAQANLMAWFDAGMERVSGWYKRSTHWILFWIGLGLAVGLNINTLRIIDYLSRNPTARAVIVEQARAATADTAFVRQSGAEARAALDSLHLPIGWASGWGAPSTGEIGARGPLWGGIFAPILGWLITALAATVGAPFWFDLLKKVMVVRSTVAPKGTDRRSAEPAPVPQMGAVSPGVGDDVHAAGARAVSSMATATAPPIPALRPVNDRELAVDACDVDFSAEGPHITRDDELPAAEGGVA
jgi:hypothetical protein